MRENSPQCHPRKISWNQLFSIFFSKNVTFTKFLSKNCDSKLSKFPHCATDTFCHFFRQNTHYLGVWILNKTNTSHFISKLISTEISWFFVKPSEFRTRKCKQRVIRKWKILICNETKILKLLKLKFNSIRIDSYFSFFYLGCTLNFYFLNNFFDRPITPAVAHWPEIFGAVFPVLSANVSYPAYKTHGMKVTSACILLQFVKILRPWNWIWGFG